MTNAMRIGDLIVEVTIKDVKNLHLSVHPPEGSVSIAAPCHLSESAIRAFAIGKLSWIRRQQSKLQAQERETPREYIHRESHYVWGRRCLLRVVERDAPPEVDWSHSRLTLNVRPGMAEDRRGAVLEAWYRAQLRDRVAPLQAEWERRLSVKVERVFVQRMKTQWGSCNTTRRSIRLNTDLAKKPPECLDYILAHELIHLLEPTHNRRFLALLDQFLPGWPQRRALLNSLPVRHAEWDH